jgi:predicted transcriptional regulator YdeE
MRKLISETSIEELQKTWVSLTNEYQALEGTIRRIERELFRRNNPELPNQEIDTYIEIYE